MTALDLARIGCSDYPTLVGADSYGSPFGLYCRVKKLGEPPRSENLDKRADHGRRFERPIFAGWAAKNDVDPGALRVVENVSRAPAKREWQRYTPDFVVPDMKRVVQTKLISTHRFMNEGWSVEDGSDGVPDRLVYQVIGEIEAMRSDAEYWRTEHGLDPFELEFADVAVTEIQFGEMQDRVYRVPYVAAIAEMLVETAEKFWRDHIVAGVPPPADGSERCADVIRMLHPNHSDEMIDASEDDDRLVEEYFRIRDEMKRLETEKKKISNTLLLKVKESGGIRGDGWRARMASRDTGPRWQEVAAVLANRLSLSDAELEAIAQEHIGKTAEWLDIRTAKRAG